MMSQLAKAGRRSSGLSGISSSNAEPAFQLAHDPPEHGRPVGAVGRCPDEVQ